MLFEYIYQVIIRAWHSLHWLVASSSHSSIVQIVQALREDVVRIYLSAYCIKILKSNIALNAVRGVISYEDVSNHDMTRIDQRHPIIQ